MAVSKDEILEAISAMSVMDVVELIKSMEDKFGVSAAAAVAVAAPVAAAAAVEEKTEFNVVLAKAGDNKINVIKVVRDVIINSCGNFFSVFIFSVPMHAGSAQLANQLAPAVKNFQVYGSAAFKRNVKAVVQSVIVCRNNIGHNGRAGFYINDDIIGGFTIGKRGDG